MGHFMENDHIVKYVWSRTCFEPTYGTKRRPSSSLPLPYSLQHHKQQPHRKVQLCLSDGSKDGGRWANREGTVCIFYLSIAALAVVSAGWRVLSYQGRLVLIIHTNTVVTVWYTVGREEVGDYWVVQYQKCASWCVNSWDDPIGQSLVASLGTWPILCMLASLNVAWILLKHARPHALFFSRTTRRYCATRNGPGLDTGNKTVQMVVTGSYYRCISVIRKVYVHIGNFE